MAIVLAQNPEVSQEERDSFVEPQWYEWLLLSLAMPKPDGSLLEIELLRSRRAGALASPVSTLAYDRYGRLTTLTNADSSTQTFTYNSADQMLTNVEEIGKTTSKVYDSLGRQTSTTNRVSATSQLAYGALSRVIKQTDALGNIIDVQYNNRGWVSKTIYPARRVNP